MKIPKTILCYSLIFFGTCLLICSCVGGIIFYRQIKDGGKKVTNENKTDNETGSNSDIINKNVNGKNASIKENQANMNSNDSSSLKTDETQISTNTSTEINANKVEEIKINENEIHRKNIKSTETQTGKNTQTDTNVNNVEEPEMKNNHNDPKNITSNETQTSKNTQNNTNAVKNKQSGTNNISDLTVIKSQSTNEDAESKKQPVTPIKKEQQNISKSKKTKNKKNSQSNKKVIGSSTSEASESQATTPINSRTEQPLANNKNNEKTPTKSAKVFTGEIPGEFCDFFANEIMGQAYIIKLKNEIILNHDTFENLKKIEFDDKKSIKILNSATIKPVSIESNGEKQVEFRTKNPLTNPISISFDNIKIGIRTVNFITCISNSEYSLIAEIFKSFEFHEDKDLSLKIKNYVEEQGFKALDKYFDAYTELFMTEPVILPTCGKRIDFQTIHRDLKEDRTTFKFICPFTNNFFGEKEATKDYKLEKEITDFLESSGDLKEHFYKLKKDDKS